MRLAGIAINGLIILTVKSSNLFATLYQEVVIDYSIMMIMVNLLPVRPLDGSKLIEVILELFFDSEYASDLSFYLSILFLVILTIACLIFRKWPYLIFIIYLLMKNIKERKSMYQNLYHKMYFFKKIYK